MTVLVLGERGQLARALAGLPDAGRMVFAGRRVFDLGTDDPAPLLDAHRPAAVINAAVYAGVDAAEGEPEACFRVNLEGPAQVAALCAEREIPLVHVSTDYVFDGEKGAPYVETDVVRPVNAYGRSKAAGEAAVAAAGGRHAILRTSWVYGADTDFIGTVIALARTGVAVRMVADQWNRPTWARDLAALTLAVADRLAEGDAAASGVFHAAGLEDATRADMAQVVLAEASRRGLRAPGMSRVTRAAFMAAAVRPADTRLDSSLARDRLGWNPSSWRETLPRLVADRLA